MSIYRRLDVLRLRIRSLLRRQTVERDLDEELRFHIDREIEAQVRRGLSPADARRAAMLSLGGNPARVRETTRETWGWTTLERVGEDVRYAVRVLRRRPAFTAAAVLSLALGTGANTAVFSLIDALLVEKLPVSRPDEIVQLQRVGGGSSTYAEYRALQSGSRQLQAVTGVSIAPTRPMEIVEAGETREVFIQVVAENYFQVLGVRASRGRLFGPPRPGERREAVAVISDRYWTDRYGRDPAVLGTRFRFGQRRDFDFTIVGVAAPGFGGAHVDVPADIWLPAEVALPNDTLRMMGRLAPGASLHSAEAEVNALIPRPMRLVSGAQGYSYLRAELAKPLVLLALLVGLVFLVTCANLANLTLAASIARGREIALRRAIGASRWRIVRQLTVESLVLAVAGAAAGWMLAGWISATLLAFLPPEQNRAALSYGFEPNLAVLAFATAVCLLTTLVCGLVPAVRATRVGPGPPLKLGGGAGQRHRSWPGRCLIAGQVAICALLLGVAGVFIQTVENLRSQRTGYVEDGLLVADVQPPFEYGEERRDQLLEELRQRAAGLPGVAVVAFGHSGQLSGDTFDYRIRTGRTDVDGSTGDLTATEERVAPGYLPAMGTRLISGRDISSEDRATAPPVAIVNQAFVRQFGITGDPVGQHFTVQRQRLTETLRIVGVAEDAKWVSLREEPRAVYYRPYAQLAGHPQVRFALRGSGDLRTLASAFTQLAHSIDRGFVLRNVVPFRQIVDRTIAVERLIAQVSTAVAGFGLLVALIGLYGVVAYAVERRRREIGVRLAIGAPPGSVMRMMLGESWALAAVGLAFGVPAVVIVLRLVGSMLFGLTPADPVTIGSVIALVVVSTTVAAYIPARRAAHIDPIVALRDE